MTLRYRRPNHREKCFGDGKPVPLDREGKNRVMVRARALMRPTEPGKHYGKITAKAFEVFKVLLWGFHNSRSGVCFPSYETIADRAGCARSTIAEAIKMLETAGLLSWVHRIVRIREAAGRDMFGQIVTRARVIRTSNGYFFPYAKSSESELPSGTSNQELIPLPQPPKEAEPTLAAALLRLQKACGAA